MRTSAHCAILRVKSPPHLEPRDIQRFLEHSFAAKRRENASAPQNGISSQTQQGIPPQGFQNHIPARGRKPSLTPLPGTRRSFQNHIPARGRKQFIPYLDNIFVVAHFKTISPQGDGNVHCEHRTDEGLYHFKTISPQGDGNYFDLTA